MATPFHSRADWGARPPRSVTRRNLTELTAHYGGPSPWGASADRSSPARFAATTDHNRCATIVRSYQNFHMDSRGWSDIAYSSLVCPHEHRYEGRGPDVRTAANGTTVGNDTAHATCYIAGDGDPLTDGAKLAYADEDVRLDGLNKGHRDWKATSCPGDPLYGWVHGGQPLPGSAPTPPPPPKEDSMIIRDTATGGVYAVGDAGKRHIGQGEWGAWGAAGIGTVAVDTATVNSIPNAPDAGVIERQTNVRRVVIGNDSAGDDGGFPEAGGGAVYITDGIVKRRILGWDNVAITDFADFAETGPSGQPFTVSQAWLDAIPRAGSAVADVDEPAIVAAILAGLDPTTIADLIGDDVAQDVADLLHARLAS